MKKIYERPEAEVVSFTALEQIAAPNMEIKLDVSDNWELVSRPTGNL